MSRLIEFIMHVHPLIKERYPLIKFDNTTPTRRHTTFSLHSASIQPWLNCYKVTDIKQ